MSVKILVFDVETSPMVGTAWTRYQEGLIDVIQEVKVISIAWKWIGERKVYCMALPDFKGYKAGLFNIKDKELCKVIFNLLDKADIAIAHNGKAFDTKVCNARMIANGLRPPKPYAVIDTKTVAKQNFKFTSNKLEDIGKDLGIGQKLSTGGYELWRKCLDGDERAWAKMKRYNKQDVVLLEEAYLTMRAWMPNHPNMNVYNGTKQSCKHCGGENTVINKTFTRTNTGQRTQWRCKDCGGYSTGTHLPSRVLLR